MPRPVTLFTGQWADLPLEVLAEKAASWGYDGLELACWGDHFDPERGAKDKSYCAQQRGILEKHGLQLFAISHHLAGQLVCDPLGDEHKAFAPVSTHGDKEAMRAWAIETMKNCARAAKNLGVRTVNGFTGSSIWAKFYGFPPISPAQIEAGFQDFAAKWNPILDVFRDCGVRFALEVHPTEIAFDYWSTQRALEAVGRRPEFGINFDPSHLEWQGLDCALFVRDFGDRIYHVHVKDTQMSRDGRAGVLNSHLGFNDHRRGWEFRSPGRGQIDFEAIVRALNDVRYEGPLSVEWEDNGMDREHGAAEAVDFVKSLDFRPNKALFDDAFQVK